STETTRTRSPAAMAVSATHTHSSAPRIGRWKRTLPRWNGSTAPTSRPTSPSTVPSAVPISVLCRSRRNTRNHSATMAIELMPQTSNCVVGDRSPASSISRPTSSAPRPNQSTKKAGIANSSRISSTPPTTQYHHSIVIVSLRDESPAQPTSKPDGLQRKDQGHRHHGENHHQQGEGHTDLHEVAETITARAQHQGVHRRRDRRHEGGR